MREALQAHLQLPNFEELISWTYKYVFGMRWINAASYAVSSNRVDCLMRSDMQWARVASVTPVVFQEVWSVSPWFVNKVMTCSL